MTRILGPTGSGRRRRAAIGAVICSVALLGLVVVPAQAALDRGLFELDKNAQNDVLTYRDPSTPPVTGPLGTLRSNINATQTSFEVCQASSTNPGTPVTILIDSEEMTVGSISNLSGGGCSGSFKRSYSSITRGVDVIPPDPAPPGTTAASHAGGELVTRITVTSVAGADWDNVFAAADWLATPPGDSTCTNLGAVECQFVHDGRGASIFTQSKDYDEISDEGGATAVWQWRNSSVPDADELDDGFAIKYADNDSQELFFGADRFATNGTKDAGFWFFHDTVAALGDGSTDGPFSGLHTAPNPGADGTFCDPATGGDGGPTSNPANCTTYDDDDSAGDILVLTTFTGGGAVTTIRVFEWIGPAGSVAALVQRGAASDCVPGDSTQLLCATVNDTTVESPWPYSGKGESAADNIPNGGLLEGGINLSDLGLEGCFSSFMATTRSSASLTADPKDFILGNFEACGATITTDASDDEFEIGGSITDSATVTVTGGGPAPTGFVDFFVCGPEDGISTCDDTGTEVSSEDLAGAVVTNGNEYTVTSDPFTPTAAGDYCFFAIYGAGQDANYPNGATLTDFTDECFTVTPLQPTLTTQASGTVEIGNPISDTATLSGTSVQPDGDPAEGTITFNLYGPDDADCSGPVAFSATVPVSGDDDYNSGEFTPTAAGTYRWTADYSGDPPNTLDAHSGCNAENESVVISPGQPVITTTASAGPVLLGSPISDTAHLVGTTNKPNGNPAGGTITFNLYGPDDADCSGPVAFSATVPVSGDDDYNSGEFTPTTAGTYRWTAEYSGDPPNTLGAGPTACDDPAESILVRAQPTITTDAIDGPVLIGDPISDTATLTGTSLRPNGDPANGTITFNLYGPDDADCSGAVVYSNTVTVSGDDDYSSGNFTPTAAGTYRWIAEYSGDPPNTLGAGPTACDDPAEATLVQAQPTITTDATADPPTGVPLGTAISDSATLSGTSLDPDGSNADGNITFALFGPDDPTCANPPIFIDTDTPVDGDGTYFSDSFTPTEVGTYRWIAAYSGDAPNTLPVSGSCNDENEASLIFSLTPSVSTSQFFYPNDSATISVGAGDGALAGFVRFRVWTNDQCDGTPLYDSGDLDVTTGTGSGLTRTLETTNITERVSGDVAVYWQVDYDSTNTAHNDVPGTCGMEFSTIDVTDTQ